MDSRTKQSHATNGESKKCVRAALRLLFLVIFVGWIIMWVIVISSFYIGANLVLFTFPIMLIAALSCVYLHLESKYAGSHNESSRSRLAFLRRPVLVKSPLGIVTSMELMFSAMFIVLMIWSLGNYLCVSYQHLHMHKVGEKVWQAKFRSVFLRLGYVGNISWAFLFFPVTRGSTILPLVGLTSESSYHIWLGHISMVLFALHSIGFFIYWGITDQMAEVCIALNGAKTYVSNVAGEIAWVLSLAMWATSIPRVRRKMFELFFYTHYLYIIYLVFYILHVGSAYFCTILPGVFLFLIDRFLQSRKRVRLVSARVLPCETVELNFSKSPELHYSPTSMVYINIPSISKLQWHPLTITSNSNMEPDTLSLVIKCGGNWSENLYQKLSSTSCVVDRLDVSIEGPYGPNSPHFLRHDVLVMVTGGRGITPMISIIKEVMFRKNTSSNATPKLILISAFKKSADLGMLDLLLPISGTPWDISSINLQIEAYVTTENQETENTAKRNLQTISFKPNDHDEPLTATLGPNSWLWLAAAASGAFLWNKKNLSGNRVQNKDIVTPTMSPAGLATEYPNQELESVPRQTLAQATSVHYASRPDLKSKQPLTSDLIL
ncbi:hypothetical protein MKX01_010780 [Papaver californicum]|nr:hypothetical protein MKX01_010780 [Papaver californicum]